MNDLSATQISYIQKHKHHVIKVRILRVLILILFLLLWEICAATELIDPFIFSSPSRVILCFLDMLHSNQLTLHIGITLFETIASFFIVIGCTLLFATLLWLSKSVSETLEPYLIVLNSLPKSALAPLLIVWLGGSYKTIIVTGISVAVFGSILSLYHAFMNADKEEMLLIRTLGGNRRDILLKIMLPGNIPTLLSIMKVNIGLCLVGVIIGEFIAAKQGLGYLIIYGSQVFKLDWVILSIILLCLIALLLYQIISRLEKRYTRR